MNRIRSLSVFLFSLITVLLFSSCSRCEARNSISVGESLSGETLVSAGSIFELGFFTPEGNAKGNRYLGIWYYGLLNRTVVWVAKRDTPLPSSCGVLGIGDDGNVQVVCDNGWPIPITSLERSENFNRTLQLLDSGNLVLVDGKSGVPLWQSFHEPTDTFLHGMEINDALELTSWNSSSDPSTGYYVFRQEQGVYVIQNKSTFYWKSDEPGLFMKTNNLPSFVEQLFTDSDEEMGQKSIQLQRNKTRPISYGTNYSRSFSYNSSRLVMHSAGKIQFYRLVNRIWELLWSAPEGRCDEYSPCGNFGICRENDEPMCICPDGYKHASSDDWRAGVFLEGCYREQTSCKQTITFFKILLVSVGGQAMPYDQAQEDETCKEGCLNDCRCVAYAFYTDTTDREANKTGPKCFTWSSGLVFHGFGTGGRFNLYLRISPFHSGAATLNSTKGYEAHKNDSQRTYVIIITSLVAGIILLSLSGCILYQRRRMAARSGYHRRAEASHVFFSNQSERQVNNLMQENQKRIDVPFYDLESILSATDNFSDANKLGQGGFGPVYKGRFPGGNEIAVKRLSSCSGQGIDEFLNEVILIAKLQHRNLVRLLGYCIKGSEKILLYEYMPNRSLDAFIFDQHDCSILDWKKRFNIILGIARGLLYLHQDSRLRIIHRDLKTSNILLDEEMNPKISDFGLARIVEGKGTEASTNKVVGTYGYMSPEYALDGKFSTKSDVFSFGVVMLEIISGRKNTGFYNPHEVLNLLGYAWRLWCDNKALDIIDPTMLQSCDKSEVIKCINIGLLCVQEDPNDRPPMSTVVIMLGSETSPLPLPTQPAFVVRRRLSSTSSSSSAKPDTISINQLTASGVQGR